MFCDDLFLQPQADDRPGIRRACPEAKEVIALLQHPAGPPAVIGREVRKAQRHSDSVRLSGREHSAFSEGRQALERLIELHLRLRHIELQRFLSGHAPRVLHFGRDRDGLAVEGRLLFADFKSRIRQAEAEGKHRHHPSRVKVPVADIDALPVAGLIHVAEIPDGGIIVKAGPGGRKLSGGVGLSQQDIGQHSPGLHAELREEQNVSHFPEHRRQVHRPAHIQYQEEPAILLLQAENVANFRLREGDVARDVLPVVPFAGGPRQHIHGGFSAALHWQIIFRFRHDRAHAFDNGVGVVPSRAGLDLPDEVFLRLLADRIIGVQPGPGGQAEARRLQSLFHAHKIA